MTGKNTKKHVCSKFTQNGSLRAVARAVYKHLLATFLEESEEFVVLFIACSKQVVLRAQCCFLSVPAL